MGAQGPNPGTVVEIEGMGEAYEQVIGADTLKFPCPSESVGRY